MLLGDFLKELKHSSSWIEIVDIKTSRTEFVFKGTLGVLKNNIHYQEKWCKYKIFEIKAGYDENMKCEFLIYIYKLED
jgi:hypothetical protein